ncbi:MAG: hypothetical protein WCT18_01960 [Patescibacteria group bacterium]
MKLKQNMCDEEKFLRRKNRLQKQNKKPKQKDASLASQVKKMQASNFYSGRKNKKIKVKIER